MKTLNEVIEALAFCCDMTVSDCGSCKWYKAPDCEVQNDALHYLREYKKLDSLDNIAFREDAEERTIYCPNCGDGFILLPESNKPLTWDELRTMEGKPVWVVEKGYQTWEYWSLVYWTKDDELTLLNCDNGQTTYSKNEQGTVWQAYRKERE